MAPNYSVSHQTFFYFEKSSNNFSTAYSLLEKISDSRSAFSALLSNETVHLSDCQSVYYLQGQTYSWQFSRQVIFWSWVLHFNFCSVSGFDRCVALWCPT